jgi:hypothetical protein
MLRSAAATRTRVRERIVTVAPGGERAQLAAHRAAARTGTPRRRQRQHVGDAVGPGGVVLRNLAGDDPDSGPGSAVAHPRGRQDRAAGEQPPWRDRVRDREIGPGGAAPEIRSGQRIGRARRQRRLPRAADRKRRGKVLGSEHERPNALGTHERAKARERASGEGGIRTPERGQPPLRDFQSRPFNRSGTSPGSPPSLPLRVPRGSRARPARRRRAAAASRCRRRAGRSPTQSRRRS